MQLAQRISHENRLSGFLSGITEMQDGDLVFRRGKSLSSYAVFMTDAHSNFSHVGMIVHENGCPFIIHAVPDESKGPEYVKKELPKDFFSFKRCSSGALYRVRCDTKTKEKAAETAHNFYEKAIEFDHAFDLSDQEKLYCTELVYNAFFEAGFNLTNNRFDSIHFPTDKKMLLPGSFLAYAPLTQLNSFNTFLLTK